MSKGLKSFIGFSIIFALVLIGVSSVIFSRSFSDFAEENRSFSVSAEGEVTTKPDVAEINFSVITQGGENLKELQNENSEKMNSAIQFLKDKGVAEEDIQTAEYNIDTRQTRFGCPTPKLKRAGNCPPPEIVGYTVTQNVNAKIRDFSEIGNILTGVVENGANSVSDLTFTVDDKSSLKDKAREKAIKKAKEKAQKIAEESGFDLGSVISVHEGFSVPYKRNRVSMDAAEGGAVRTSPQIEAGSQKITSSVTLEYEIR